MNKPIYLDYNATTPIDPAVAETMMPFIHNHFGNPSSSHLFGTEAKRAVEKARKQVAAMLGCGVDEIVFTSGGSESNNYAIRALHSQIEVEEIISLLLLLNILLLQKSVRSWKEMDLK